MAKTKGTERKPSPKGGSHIGGLPVRFALLFGRGRGMPRPYERPVKLPLPQSRPYAVPYFSCSVSNRNLYSGTTSMVTPSSMTVSSSS